MQDHSTSPENEAAIPYRPHIGDSRQYIRDIILGVNDGLVSTFLLVAGVVGGGLASSQVLLTAIAAAIAGAVSMAAGEYLATRSQEEVFDREITLEEEHIAYHRQTEVEQLRGFFEDIGVHDDDVDTAIRIFSRDDDVLLGTMKVFEFGLVDSERRNPVFAMVTSGLLFIVGALPSTLPFAFTDSPYLGLAWAAVLAAVALFAVGAIKTSVTGGSIVKAGGLNLGIAAVGGAVAYFVGQMFGTVVG